MLSFSYVPTGPRAESHLKPSIIVHGGAGSGRYVKDDKRYGGLEEAVEAGLSAMKKGSGLDGVVAAVRSMEDSGLFNCGRGAYLTAEGKVELDAAVMSGEGLAGAGVGNVTSTHTPVTLARWVMENTRHVLVVGNRTRDYVRLAGLEVEELTPSKRVAARFEALRREAKYSEPLRTVRRFEAGDTVGAVALGSDGVPAAAVSTGGTWMKLPGRVGDSAILGAGLFADSGLGASCATGTGEEIIRVGLCMKACEFMGADDAQRAAVRAIEQITKVRGKGTAGIVTVDLKGGGGGAFNTEAMGRAWFDPQKGRVVAAVGPDP
ncbi:MAG: isoaspartyl peptidase/L-asparaginase [Nitrososphaerota archaeon]|nr:isoaspartyl peptidase/L-asparaginase [Nitrososphaerota archaeon]